MRRCKFFVIAFTIFAAASAHADLRSWAQERLRTFTECIDRLNGDVKTDQEALQKLAATDRSHLVDPEALALLDAATTKFINGTAKKNALPPRGLYVPPGFANNKPETPPMDLAYNINFWWFEGNLWHRAIAAGYPHWLKDIVAFHVKGKRMPDARTFVPAAFRDMTYKHYLKISKNFYNHEDLKDLEIVGAEEAKLENPFPPTVMVPEKTEPTRRRRRRDINTKDSLPSDPVANASSKLPVTDPGGPTPHDPASAPPADSPADTPVDSPGSSPVD